MNKQQQNEQAPNAYIKYCKSLNDRRPDAPRPFLMKGFALAALIGVAVLLASCSAADRLAGDLYLKGNQDIKGSVQIGDVRSNYDLTLNGLELGPHNLLSRTHTDTTAAAVVRGDLVTGQGASAKWARLAIGANGLYLSSDGTDVSWAAVPAGPSYPIIPSLGGTGVANNDLSTLTITGAFPLTLTLTAGTGVTLPTTGTLATLAGTEYLSSKTIDLETTTDVNSGIVLKDGLPILHDYPAGGADNIFVGVGAGNFALTGGQNVGIGVNSLTALTNGAQNVAVGWDSLLSLQGGNYNVAIGRDAGPQLTSGNGNTMVGTSAGTLTSTGSNNVFVGYRAGRSSNTSSNSTMLGYYAGYYETASNKLFIDNAQRASEADGRVKSLVYGIFDAATANQYFTVNGNLSILETSTFNNTVTIAGGKYLSFVSPTVNSTVDGIVWTKTAGENLAFGDMVYLKSDGKLYMAIASAGTTSPAVYMAVETITTNNTGKVLSYGEVKNTGWAWTIGSGTANVLYLNTSTGTLTQSAPDGSSGNQIQVAGIALTSTSILFNPNYMLLQIR